jgi:hypothetical protein
VYLIFSNDLGVSWKAYSLDPYNSPYYVTTNASSISISNTSGNDYFLITSNLFFNPSSSTYENGTCCVSSNGGTSFSVPSGVTGNDFIYSSMSDNGQYQVFVTATNTNNPHTIPSRLYLSSNYGTSFSQIIQLSYTDTDNYLIFGGVSMSANGKYITASVLNQYAVFKYIYVSSDYGVTWKQIINDIDGNSFTGVSLGFINLNYSGKYQLLAGTNALYISDSYGVN